MALTGKFGADFSSFTKAVDTAVIKVNDLGVGAAGVETKLNRMVDNFTGRKVIQDATLMVAAIEAVGGASTLTAGELAKVSARASEAVDKLEALGRDVPSGLQNLANSATAATTKTQGLTGAMVAASTAVGTFVGHMAALGFEKFVSGVEGLVASGFQMNASLETTTLKFTTLMGDSDMAAAHVKDLFEIAKKTPFETGPIIEASLKLQTFGGAALNTKANIMLLGDASAATGAPINELGFWVGRMYAMLQGGKPFGEAAMRLQELAVLSPKARDQMEAMQASGKSGAEIFDAFKDSLGKFTGAMTAQAGTWEGVVSTFTDTVNIMVAQTLKPYFEVIRDLGAKVNEALDGMSGDMDKVSTATAGTKKAFADFVTTGITSVIKGLSFLMVEFNAAKVVFGDLAQAFEVLNRAAAQFQRFKIKSSDILNLDPETAKQVAILDKSIADMTASINARGKALQADKQAEKDWTDWGNKAVETVVAMTKGLGDATSAAAVHGKATDDAGAGVKKLTEEQKASAKALQEYADAGETYAGTVDKMNGAVVEGIKYDLARQISQKTIENQYGVTAAQIKAITEVQKDEQDALKDSDAALENNVKHLADFEAAGVKAAEAVAKGLQGQRDVLVNLGFQINPRVDPNFIGPLEEEVQKALEEHPLPPISAKVMAQVSPGAQINPLAVGSGEDFIGPQIRDLSTVAGVAADKMEHLRDTTDESGDSFKKLSDDLGGLSGEFAKLAQISGGSFGGILKSVGSMVGELSVVTKAVDQFKGSQASMTADGKTDYAGMASSVATMGASAVGTFQGIRDGTASVGAGMVSLASKGAAIGSIIPGIGTAVGAVIGGVAGLVAGLTRGVSQAEKDGRAMEAQFEATYGGFQGMIDKVGEVYAATGRSSQQAQADVKALLDAEKQGPDAVKAALGKIQTAFDDQAKAIKANSLELDGFLGQVKTLGGTLPKALQDSIDKLIETGKVSGDTKDALAALTGDQKVNFKELEDIATKYGADLTALGPKFRQAKMDDTAQGIIDDFDTLNRGIGDTDAALTVMRKPINDLVNDSIKFGTTIPENMRPWIEQLEKTGQLTDENGDKIQDLSAIKFGAPIASQFDILIAKITELVDKISGPNGLTAGINNIPAKKTTEITTVHRDVYDDSGASDATGAAMGGLARGYGVQYMAGGGKLLAMTPRGGDRVPAMLGVGEGVVSERGMRTLGEAELSRINAGIGAGGGGGGDAALHAEVQGLRQDMADRDRLLPKVIRDAILLAPRRAA